ncbi:uncharacterized protein FSUBG_6936 [Fusarium subglutinans]|uniref:Uncharacterized protein n=1 Tax=Gibberella subglutinans TaxID=42677 RepID=A0A8H5PXW9_GIBSU|nr:uncharacterized protein FSUBG_6936 [Fusarium subglutinans]KAF5604163.1 hypothetical protein FSUBG_6936 [Fusarium subglutinans]
MTKNKRYEQGDKIQIKYETDIDQIAIEIYQIPLNGVSAYRSLARNGSANPRYWLAEYDYLGLAEGNEDSVYWFTLFKSSQGRVAWSDYFNVSSSKADETTSGSVSATATGLGLATSASGQHTSTSTAGSETDTEHTSTTSITSTASTISSTSSTKSGSGLSQGATAGITAGAIIGGLLILGGIGLLVWRRFGKGRKNVKGTEETQNQQHQFYPLETKVELPSDITTHPSEYATSRPGLHEAP